MFIEVNGLMNSKVKVKRRFIHIKCTYTLCLYQNECVYRLSCIKCIGKEIGSKNSDKQNPLTLMLCFINNLTDHETRNLESNIITIK